MAYTNDPSGHARSSSTWNELAGGRVCGISGLPTRRTSPPPSTTPVQPTPSNSADAWTAQHACPGDSAVCTCSDSNTGSVDRIAASDQRLEWPEMRRGAVTSWGKRLMSVLAFLVAPLLTLSSSKLRTARRHLLLLLWGLWLPLASSQDHREMLVSPPLALMGCEDGQVRFDCHPEPNTGQIEATCRARNCCLVPPPTGSVPGTPWCFHLRAPPMQPPPPAPPCIVAGTYTFTGNADSYLTATSRTGIVGGGLGFSLCAWVYRTRTGSSWERLIDFGSGTPVDNILVAFVGDNGGGSMLYRVYHLDTASHLYASPASFTPNVWTHVAVVQSRASLTDTYGPAQIYWNGVSVATTASMRFPLPVSRSNLYVGKSGWSADPMFTGQMKDLLVWDVALSQAELDAVRLGGGLPGTTAPLISSMRTWCGAAPPPSPPSLPPAPPLASMPAIPRLSASMSSTLSPYPLHNASLCINDQTSDYCHTTDEANPWLSIRISGQQAVRLVWIMNRGYVLGDCCGGRLSPFQIWVGASPGDYNSATSQACVVGNQIVPATAGPFTFDCQRDLSGTHVTLSLIHISEPTRPY